MKYFAYIASGWFNAEQAADLECIKTTLDSLNLTYFSPKDELCCPPDADSKMRQDAFNGNFTGIEQSEYVICNTRDKDMGSIFEAGYSYAARKKILYIAFDLAGKFNLMLAESGDAVYTGPRDKVLLAKFITKVIANSADLSWEAQGGHIE